MTRDEFNESFAPALMARWPGLDWRRDTIDAYFEDLAELELELALAAFTSLYREGRVDQQGRPVLPSGGQIYKRARALPVRAPALEVTPELEELWGAMRMELEQHLGGGWLTSLRPIAIKDGTLWIGASPREAGWIARRYGRALAECAGDAAERVEVVALEGAEALVA